MLPATFPARGTGWAFRLYLLLNSLLLGLAPAIILKVIPTNEVVFWNSDFVVGMSALFGMAVSAIVFLVRLPAKYIITHETLHIVSVARTRWWWCPGYGLCQPYYTINLDDITSAEVTQPMCPFPLLLLPGPWSSLSGLCVVHAKRGDVWVSPEDGRGFVELLMEARSEWHTAGMEEAFPDPEQQRQRGVQASGAQKDQQGQKGVQAPSGFIPAKINLDDYRGIHRELDFKKHKLEENDTIESLALKYQCQVSDIRKANGMVGQNRSLAAYTSLWIPHNPNTNPNAGKPAEPKSNGSSNGRVAELKAETEGASPHQRKRSDGALPMPSPLSPYKASKLKMSDDDMFEDDDEIQLLDAPDFGTDQPEDGGGGAFGMHVSSQHMSVREPEGHVGGGGGGYDDGDVHVDIPMDTPLNRR